MKWILFRLSEIGFYRKIQKTPTPGWVVLAADLFVVFISCCLLFTADAYRATSSNPESVAQRICLTLTIYLIFSLIIKSYKCVVRLSVIEDLYRAFLLVFLSTLSMFIINVITRAVGLAFFQSYWNIFFIGCISFTFLSIIRLGIKYVFIKFSQPGAKRIPVIILGSSLNSVTLASVLRNEIGGKYDPVALLSLSIKSTDSKINGISIEKYDEDKLAEIFTKYECYTLIFLSTQTDLMKRGFADKFLQEGITLLHINQVEEFDNSSENDVVSSHIKSIQIEDLLGRDPINLNNALVKDHINNECVLITGAAGSIGSEIVRQVASFGASQIVLVDQAETPMHNMQLEMQEKFKGIKISLFIGDVLNKDRMEQAFTNYQPKYVFHAAAYKHVPMMENNPSEAILTNVVGTKNMADLSLKHKVYKFVMISTDKAVNPTNIMGATKRIAEIYVQSLFFNAKLVHPELKTQFITTRFGNVLGSNGSVIPRFRQQIEEGGPVTVTHKDIIRYFMTIKEACSLVLEAGCMGKGGEIYIFDMGSPVKIYDLACRMISLAGLKVGKDINIIETGLRPGEKLYEELLNDKEKTTATNNQKIMIAKVQKYDYNMVCTRIAKIADDAYNGNIHNLVFDMKHLVPEFKSNNSCFEAIDHEIEEEGKDKESIIAKDISITA